MEGPDEVRQAEKTFSEDRMSCKQQTLTDIHIPLMKSNFSTYQIKKTKSPSTTSSITPQNFAQDHLSKFYSHNHMQKSSNLEFSVYERTNKAHNDAVHRELVQKWTRESTSAKMEQAKQMANAFSLSEELVNQFKVPTKSSNWGERRKECRTGVISEAEQTGNSEYVKDEAGRTLRKLRIIDWKKSLLKLDWEKNKCSVFNFKNDPRAMKVD